MLAAANGDSGGLCYGTGDSSIGGIGGVVEGQSELGCVAVARPYTGGGGLDDSNRARMSSWGHIAFERVLRVGQREALFMRAICSVAHRIDEVRQACLHGARAYRESLLPQLVPLYRNGLCGTCYRARGVCRLQQLGLARQEEYALELTVRRIWCRLELPI